jgi:hypothetical protein
METKRDLEQKAKSQIDSNPDEAVRLYKELIGAFPEEFNEWDALYAVKATRGCQIPDLSWAKQLVEKFREEKVGNIYGWLIFDHCVKGKQRAEMIQNEAYILSLPEFSPQKDLRADSTYPCPSTISIFKLADAFGENIFNAKKINQLLSLLDFNFLSDETKTIHVEKRGEIELASDLEKYFALKTKALIKLEQFEECKELCEIALISLTSFHYNNDLWFKMRVALVEEHLGNFEESETLFKELLSSKAGSDKWFLYRDIAEVYYEHENYNKAWKYAVDAAYYGNEPHFLIGLYLLQARILFKLERADEGKLLAELISSILKEQGWRDKTEYNRLFDYYKIDRENTTSTKSIMEEARRFWNSERYGGKEKKHGLIISIHRNGKIGRIKEDSGKLVGFHKKDLVKRVRSLDELMKAKVEFYEMLSEDGQAHAENIVIIEKAIPDELPSNALVGQTVEGTVKKTVEFGVFISIPGSADGLIHKSNLPEHMRGSFQTEFNQGDKLNVVVVAATNKGLELKLNG